MAVLIVRPNSPCELLCAATLGSAEIVVIENGKVLPMQKDPSFFVFHAWIDVPPEELPEGIDVEIRVCHADCFLQSYGAVDKEEHAYSNRYCAICGQDFDLNPYGNQITLGRIDLEEEVFIEDGSAKPMILCRGCLLDVLEERS
jgi:hypothetical protein